MEKAWTSQRRAPEFSDMFIKLFFLLFFSSSALQVFLLFWGYDCEVITETSLTPQQALSVWLAADIDEGK